MESFIKDQSGISPLVSILIIAAAVMIIAANSALIGQGEMDMSLASAAGKRARFAATACANEAMQQVKLNSAYLVSGLTLSQDDSSCTISVIASSTDRIIMVLAETQGYYQQLKISLKVGNTAINIYDWQEN